MNLRLLKLPCAGLVAACVPLLAAAQDGPTLQLSGYGTAGLVYSGERHADYIIDAFKPNGPGATRATSADVDSRLGLQLSVNLHPRVSAVVQVVSQQRYDNSYQPVVEWANVKFQATPDFSLRAGRIVLPVFLVTDTRKLGYANPWVRPPVEVYSMVPVTSSDGIDASYRLSIGAANNTLQVTTGRSNANFPPQPSVGAGVAKTRRIFAVVDTLEQGFLTARLSYGQARLTIDAYDPLFDAFRQFGAAGAAIADRYELEGRKVDFLGIGANYDPGPWFATGEWAHFDTHSIVGAKSAWYASAGARFGRVTPYATYARMKSDRATSDPGLALTGLPSPLAGLAAQLNGALNAQLAVIPDQTTWSIGARWDFRRDAALKLQYDLVKPASGSHGTFGNPQPGFEPGKRVNLFSAAVDFVF